MVRKLVLTGVSVLGLALPLAASASADAHEKYWVECHRCCEWKVYFRRCCNDRWEFYACYSSEHSARHAMHRLERDGFEVFMRD